MPIMVSTSRCAWLFWVPGGNRSNLKCIALRGDNKEARITKVVRAFIVWQAIA